ncbi:sporulation protein YjcZ [Paenibacillus elgii]|uniref:Sporulation protein YjcZ n=1 Tax=Paenibacillus elgii TaxID=189691 RepID=A0A2T6G9Z1_9BACL|nr:sporulation protein YjcZ [Paenibacillus elgii]MCM3271213.1 sporulation protein YjcZ [Paenibacillus elgii]NEN82877.1 sporulation protein YjcZ [Paenibacillus elgii]PUA40965.1 sporulation protein YjcZ [Paenibacillus elgii]
MGGFAGGGLWTSTAVILVLFILLVIVSCSFWI